MSQELLAAHARGQVQVAIGRASDFYGPGVLASAMGERVFRPALAGQAAQIMGRADMPHTYTYIRDIGEGLAVLGEHEAAFGQAWHLPSARTVTTRQFIELVYAAAAGHPARIQAPPRLLVRALGLVNPMVRELGEMLYEFEEPFILDDRRFVAAFGNHATPLETAIEATVAWYRAQPETQPGGATAHPAAS
jgi:nucleoside-diphosphate-sugar epimerase